MSDFTVVKIDLEGLRRRLASNDVRFASMTEVHAWLRDNRFVATATPNVYVRGRTAEPVLREDEVLSRKIYI